MADARRFFIALEHSGIVLECSSICEKECGRELAICSGMFFELQMISLVKVFKFFSERIDEKCLLFFMHFSPKKYVKNSKLFQTFLTSR